MSTAVPEWGDLWVRVIRGRWFTLFASFLIMAGAGGTYLFGIYSKCIKTSLAYDQTTLNFLGFFKDLGANVGVPSGLFAQIAPTWLVLLIGSALNFAGYFMIFLAVTSKIPKPRLWHMCVYICIGANSQNFANTGALVTCVTNFPESRGAVLGLLKGFVGLSGAVMTEFYLAIYGGDDPQSLILLIAWLPAAISVVFVYTIRTVPRGGGDRKDTDVFYRFLYVSVLLALFLMSMTIAQKLVVFSRAAYAGTATVVCILLFIPLIIAVQEEFRLYQHQTSDETPTRVHDSLTSSSQIPSNTVSDLESDMKFPTQVIRSESIPPEGEIKSESEEKQSWQRWWWKPERGEDYTIFQALTSIDMWILFIATFCGLGSCLTAVDNLGQIGESLGYPSKTVSTFVSLVSIWNYFGRVFAGFVSETLLSRHRFPRPLMMTLALLLASAGHLLIAFPVPGSVYIASVIIGFAFGAQFPLLFAIISELFGLKSFSTLFNCGQLASPLGSYILNVKVTGQLYDAEARKAVRRKATRELICLGRHCYMKSFVILASVALFGATVSLVLVKRTMGFYRGDIYKRFRQEEREMRTSTERGINNI